MLYELTFNLLPTFVHQLVCQARSRSILQCKKESQQTVQTSLRATILHMIWLPGSVPLRTDLYVAERDGRATPSHNMKSTSDFVKWETSMKEYLRTNLKRKQIARIPRKHLVRFIVSCPNRGEFLHGKSSTLTTYNLSTHRWAPFSACL